MPKAAAGSTSGPKFEPRLTQSAGRTGFWFGEGKRIQPETRQLAETKRKTILPFPGAKRRYSSLSEETSFHSGGGLSRRFQLPELRQTAYETI